MSQESSQEKIQQLQLMEQNLQNLLIQRQQFQTQLIEIESALKELKNTKKSYKIIGNIMVSAEKGELEEDLKNKKEMLEIRIKNIQKQEDNIKEKSKALQEEVLKEMKKQEMKK